MAITATNLIARSGFCTTVWPSYRSLSTVRSYTVLLAGLNGSSFAYILEQVRNPSIFNAILVGQQCYKMIVDLSKFLYPGHDTTKIDNAKLPLPDMPDYDKHQSTDDYYHIKKTTGGYLWFALGDNDEY